MTDNLDRFDRMLLAHAAAASAPPFSFTGTPDYTAPEREPVIHSKRASRFVDRTACPMCGTADEGIEFHGVLMSGVKVHTIVAHTAGMKRVESGQPRCLGSGMRMVFEGGVWKGAPTP